METIFWSFLIEQVNKNLIIVEFVAISDSMEKLEHDYMLWIKDVKNNILTSIIVTEKEKKMFEYVAFIKNTNKIKH